MDTNARQNTPDNGIGGPVLVSDMREFCKTCGACQQAKWSTQLPTGKLHMLPIPTKLWELIGIDFVGTIP